MYTARAIKALGKPQCFLCWECFPGFSHNPSINSALLGDLYLTLGDMHSVSSGLVRRALKMAYAFSYHGQPNMAFLAHLAEHCRADFKQTSLAERLWEMPIQSCPQWCPLRLPNPRALEAWAILMTRRGTTWHGLGGEAQLKSSQTAYNCLSIPISWIILIPPFIKNAFSDSFQNSKKKKKELFVAVVPSQGGRLKCFTSKVQKPCRKTVRSALAKSAQKLLLCIWHCLWSEGDIHEVRCRWGQEGG